MDLSELLKSLNTLQSSLESNDISGAKFILLSIQYDVLAAQQRAHSDAGKLADLQADSNADNLSTSQAVA